MFHVELRQFPHVARAFNLNAEELERRILRPWASGMVVELQERRWAPDRAKLTIYEAPEVAVVDMGLGRGWANVTRTGADVTAAQLAAIQDRAAAPVNELKAALLAAVATGRITAADAVAMARERWPEVGEEQLASISARAVWQLLAEGRLALSAGDSR